MKKYYRNLVKFNILGTIILIMTMTGILVIEEVKMNFLYGSFIVVGMFSIVTSILLLMTMLDDSDLWKSIDNLNIEYKKWVRYSKEAMSAKKIYMQLTIDKYALPIEEFKKLLKKELSK